MAKRISIPDIAARKQSEKLVMLTAYTAQIAKLLDGYVDILLVGDSLGMVIYGMESTLPVTLEMMVRHGKAVVGASSQSCVVVDMPFGSYQAGKEDAFKACAQVMAHTGCSAVKLEGGIELEETIGFITKRGVPVMGHIGLMPQRVHATGGYGYQGRSEADAERILEDALAVEAAGAFAVVIEGVREDIARNITGKLRIPTIGIGASPACDGQVLVVDDMLGIVERTPRFVKRYAELGPAIQQAVKIYAEEVRSGAFPSESYCYKDAK